MQDRALDHALETECRLRVDVVTREDRRVLGHEVREELAQIVDVCGARAQQLSRGVRRKGDRLVENLARLDRAAVVDEE